MVNTYLRQFLARASGASARGPILRSSCACGSSSAARPNKSISPRLVSSMSRTTMRGPGPRGGDYVVEVSEEPDRVKAGSRPTKNNAIATPRLIPTRCSLGVGLSGLQEEFHLDASQ